MNTQIIGLFSQRNAAFPPVRQKPPSSCSGFIGAWLIKHRLEAWDSMGTGFPDAHMSLQGNFGHSYPAIITQLAWMLCPPGHLIPDALLMPASMKASCFLWVAFPCCICGNISEMYHLLYQRVK